MQPSPGGVLPPCQISNQSVEACLSSETNGQTSDTPKGRLVTHNPLKCEQFQLILCILSFDIATVNRRPHKYSWTLMNKLR